MSPSGRWKTCGCQVARLTRPHPVPRMRHRHRRTRRRFDREERHRVLRLCPPCHRNLHVVWSEKQLADEYHDLERLREHPDVRRFTEWIRTKSPETVVRMPRRAGHRTRPA